MRGVRVLAAAGIETGVTCVVTAANVRELAGVVEIAYYLGNVRKLGFDLLRAQGRGSGVKPAAAGELAAALRQVLATASRLERATGKRLLFSQQERAENLARCRTAGFAHCHAMNGEAVFVTVDGELYACASLAGFPAFRLGHVDSGIDPACRRRIGERIRASMTFCSACRYFSGCGGACFARWYGAGQPDSPYLPECVLKQAFIPGQQAGEQ